jgi:hypothetical protein
MQVRLTLVVAVEVEVPLEQTVVLEQVVAES